MDYCGDVEAEWKVYIQESGSLEHWRRLEAAMIRPLQVHPLNLDPVAFVIDRF